MQQLKEIGSPPYADGKGYAVQRRWSNLFEGADLFLASTFGLALAAPGYSRRDVSDSAAAKARALGGWFLSTSAVEPKTLAGEFALPMFVIHGAEDSTTPTSVAGSFLNSLHAPQKAFVTFEGGGHFAAFMKPDVFQKGLVSHVLPLAAIQCVR